MKCLCGNECETLEHFILECELYSELRRSYKFLQQPYIENKDSILANVLIFRECDNLNIEIRKDLLLQLWRKRQEKMKESETNNNSEVIHNNFS